MTKTRKVKLIKDPHGEIEPGSVFDAYNDGYGWRTDCIDCWHITEVDELCWAWGRTWEWLDEDEEERAVYSATTPAAVDVIPPTPACVVVDGTMLSLPDAIKFRDALTAAIRKARRMEG